MQFAFTEGCINIEALTGLSARQIPACLLDLNRTPSSWLAAEFGDPAIDPGANKLLIGPVQRFADFYGVRLRQMHNILAREDAGFIRRVGPIRATVVKSAENHRDKMLPADISAERQRAAQVRWGATMALALVQEESCERPKLLPPVRL